MTTPLPIDNPPREKSLTYRVGRYGDFRQSMLARLSDSSAPFAPLLALRTRAPNDPTVALIDAFAIVGDVLTFYQERLANEGYLGTATEARSVAELARLTGYRPKGGLASSVFLAFTADPAASLTLPVGARTQSVPPAGQTAQSFETSESLTIQGTWNVMTPRLSRPTQASTDLSQVFVDGIASGLKRNDPLLLVVDDKPTLRRVDTVTVQPDRKRTVVVLQTLPAAPDAGAGEPDDGGQPPAAIAAEAAVAGSDAADGARMVSRAASATDGTATTISTPTSGSTPPPAPPSLIDLVHDLAGRASVAPAANPSSPTDLRRTSRSLLSATSDAAVALAAGASKVERSHVYKALAATPLAPAAKLEVHAFRSVTAPSGARAAPRSVDANGRLVVPPEEWDLTADTFGAPASLTIAITTSRTESGSSPTAIVRAAASDLAAREGLQINSAIAYGGAALALTVPATAGSTDAGTLAPLREVTCTLRQFDSGGMVIGYEFAGQPLSLTITVNANAQATVVNQISTTQVTNLAVVDNPGNARIDVSGMLAPRTGSTSTEQPDVLYLDGIFDTVTPGTWIAFDAPSDDKQPAPPAPAKVSLQGVATVSRVAYGQTARVTRLALDAPWIDPKAATFARAIRETAVFADSTPLALAHEDIVEPVSQTASTPTLELDGFVPGLQSGRWLIVTGERLDLPGSISAEVVMLAAIDHQGATSAPGAAGAAADTPYLAGETVHTILTFAAPLAYTYKRETMTVLGNVAQATQGESVDEILGSGSGASANQAFALKKPPLTYVSAATPSGSASTLSIYVNGLQWREVPSLSASGPGDRVFVTQPTASGGVTVCFGDGVHGSRLPTGADNVRARYRSGIGASGNVGAGTISTLLSRPLGLKAVTNPLAATGGADPETLEETRRTAPIGLISLSRLVAVRDYEDFALNFAGIGKASARRFTGADGPLVHVTIAGAAGDTLDPTSDLWTSLEQALNDFGDGEHEVALAAAAARLALISANVAIDPDRLWSDVEPVLRKRLLDGFCFRRRRLGQSIHVSDVIAVMQGVPGVAYVDLRLLSAVPSPVDESQLAAAVNSGQVDTIAAHLARPDREQASRQILPGELVYLSDSLPAMLVLNEVPA